MQLLAAASLAGCRVYLAELHELIVFSDAFALHHSAHVLYVLRLAAHVIAAGTEAAYDVESLRAAGETANKRRCAFVLSASDFYSGCLCHR